MSIKLIISLVAISLFSCKQIHNDKPLNVDTSAKDTIAEEYSRVLRRKENASIEMKSGNPGKLVTTISFNVKTGNRQDYDDGIIPWANIEHPERDFPNLIDGNEIVITESKVTIIIDYPNEYKFDLRSKNGFTRKKLLKEISKNYYLVYKDEEETATIKTIPVSKRTTVYNRNETNGKYGIWGHDIGDLVLAEILVYNANGKITLSLNIES